MSAGSIVLVALAAVALDGVLAASIVDGAALVGFEGCVLWIRVSTLLGLGVGVLDCRQRLHEATGAGLGAARSVALLTAGPSMVALLVVSSRDLDVRGLVDALGASARTLAASPASLAPAGRWLTTIAVAPLVEEIIYRHLPVLILSNARESHRPADVRLGRAWAAVRMPLSLTAGQLAFAASHLPRLCPTPSAACALAELPTLADLALAGCCLAALSVATRALAPLVLVHASANLLVLALGPALPLESWRVYVGGSAALLALGWPRR